MTTKTHPRPDLWYRVAHVMQIQRRALVHVGNGRGDPWQYHFLASQPGLPGVVQISITSARVVDADRVIQNLLGVRIVHPVQTRRR